MNELTLDGKVYVSSKRAAELTGYAKDYVGQLCREGHVEARLVGRNWYVLESSIREHRFGKQEEEEPQVQEVKSSGSTWEPPRYKPEFPAYIAPMATRKEEIPEETPEPVVPEPTKTAILSDMQTAWQEWFTKKEREEGDDTESADIIEEQVVEVEEEPTQVAIRTIQEESVEEEEPEIASYESQKPLDLTKVSMTEEGVEDAVEPYTEVQTVSVARNLVLQSIFVGISVIAFAVAMIGTGFSGKITGDSIYRLPEINFISGTSVYNK